MTHDLHERLDDLVADVPAYVVPDARTAWSTGARRRTRHRVAVGAVAVVVLAILASAVTWLPHTLEPAPANPDGAGVDGYPTRVTSPWRTHDLPSRPGSLAGVLYSEDGILRGVSPTGRVWTIPQDPKAEQYPFALSADGTMLGFLRSAGEFQVRDLRAGTTVVADGVGDGGYSPPEESQPSDQFWPNGQSPAFWSSDDRTLLVLGAEASSFDETDENGALLIGADGVTSYLVGPASGKGGAAWPAGWTPAGDVVWLVGDFGHDSARWARVVVTTTAGTEVRRLELDLPRDVGGLSQWSGSISPDGTRLTLVTDTPTIEASVFSMADGSVVDRISAYDDTCPMSWSDTGPRPSFQGSDVIAVRDDRGHPQIVVDPAFGSTCAVWATDALSGSAHGGLSGRVFGSSNSWLSWYWRQVALGAGAGILLAAGAILLVVRRRRKLLAPTS